jgi:hypothetical protein
MFVGHSIRDLTKLADGREGAEHLSPMKDRRLALPEPG